MSTASEKQRAPQEASSHTRDVAVVPKSSQAVDKVKKKRKAARVQVDPATVSEEDRPPQTGTVFNVWYLKWSGGDKDDDLSQRKSSTRCNIERDSGYTKADKVPGAFFCVYFAKGMCTKGKSCEYLHRLPRLGDIYSPNVDCFGRDKFANYRDDMGGVGSFLRQNRTLYVGRIHVTDDMEEIVSRHFSEWGQIERIRVLNNRGIAFVTYSREIGAQFAKEAMAHQSLDNDETLNVRWATEDPNPAAQQREQRRLEEEAADTIKRLLPASYVAELEGRDPKARKTRELNSSFGLEGYQAPDELWFAQGENSINPDARALTGPEQNGTDADVEGDKETDTNETKLSDSGLISSDALQELQNLGAAPAPAPSKTSLISGYDSDDE